MSRKTKALEFAQEGYNITLTGRHLQVTEPMKDYAMEKVSKIERFTDRIIDVNIIMDIQRFEHRAEIILKIGNLKIVGSGNSDNMYVSIDQAVQRITEQLLKYKSKLQDYHAKGLPDIEMNVNVVRPARQDVVEVNEEIEDENYRRLESKYRPHSIVKQEKRPLKILNWEEAIMKMELSNDVFLVFVNEQDRKLNIIYRRDNGDYGIIEPEA